MSYTHLTIEERCCLREYYNKGYSYRKIAELLGRSYCHRGMFQNPKKLEYIKEKLLLTWSPEQIANTPCELDIPSMRTIYR